MVRKTCWAYGRARPREPKLWLQILTEIRNRGVQDVLIACVGGLKGFPEAMQAVYPALVAVGWIYVRRAERHEQNFARCR